MPFSPSSAEARRPQVVILTQFFAPEPCAASNRVVAMARAIASDGAHVTVVTGMPSFPAGVVDAAYRGARFRRERYGDVTVERVWTYASDRLPGKRLLNWVSVALGIMVRVLVRRAPVDVLVVSSPPITLALPALVGMLRHRARLIVDVRDVFPEVAVTMGAWSASSPLTRIVGVVAEALYRAGSRIVCVTETAREEIAARGAHREKLVLAPNGFDRVQPSANALARTDSEFVIAYVGNMGLATGLDVVLDAAVCLRDEARFRFVLVGGGVDARRLEERVKAEELHNVTLLGVLPRADALRVLADADACVIPLKRNITDSLPTKMFDAMSVGRPILLSASGEAARLLLRAQGGIAATPEDATALADAVRTLARDSHAAQRMGENGRSYVEKHFDRETIMRELAAVIVAKDAAATECEERASA